MHRNRSSFGVSDHQSQAQQRTIWMDQGLYPRADEADLMVEYRDRGAIIRDRRKNA